MKKRITISVFLLAVIHSVAGQTLTETQMRNARATGFAIVAARNPGKSFTIYMIPWDGINTLEYNANAQINSGWHAQAAIKGNFFSQTFDGSDFSQYSSVVVSQADFDLYKSTGTQWWIVCSTLSPFSNSGDLSLGVDGGISTISGTASSGAIQIKTNASYGGYSNRYLRLGWKDNNAVFSSAISVNEDLNVGIGNISPSSKLQVNGNGAGTTALSIIENPSSAVGAHFTSEGANNIMFQLKSTGGQGTNTELRTWGNSFINALYGAVGIGTTLISNTKGYKLAVNGKIGAKEVEVENTSDAWADYVFEQNYKLMPLSDVEEYIRDNKHLPEIPSKEEVEKNGHKLGEMDVLLLKKVEELTLHLIEQQKQIQELKNRLDNQQK